MKTEYISAADTAKLIRAQLARRFPGHKFSVTSKTYSGGASVRVNWTDGPTEAQIKAITDPFEGSGFDGMIDLKYGCYSWLLPDGSAALARSAGTGGSGGSDPGYSFPAPVEGARLVEFMADSVFTNRSYSVPAYTAAVQAVYGNGWAWPRLPQVEASTWDGSAMLSREDQDMMPDGQAWNLHWCFSSQLHRHLAELDLYQPPAPKTTPQPTAPISSSATSYTVEHERDWTWIRFDAKPAAEIIEALKGNLSARFSGKRAAWYITQHVEPDAISAAIGA